MAARKRANAPDCYTLAQLLAHATAQGYAAEASALRQYLTLQRKGNR